MDCKDCANKSKCNSDKTEVCNDFKAKKSKLKKILPIIGGVVSAIGAVGYGIAMYKCGKHSGKHDEEVEEACRKIESTINKYDAMQDLQNEIVKYAATGDFASEIKYENGKTQYLTYTLSDTAPDWWEEEDTRKFSIKDEILDKDYENN